MGRLSWEREREREREREERREPTVSGDSGVIFIHKILLIKKFLFDNFIGFPLTTRQKRGEEKRQRTPTERPENMDIKIKNKIYLIITLSLCRDGMNEKKI